MAHGTRVELELIAQHRAGPHSVESYLIATAIANPHATIHYRGPDGTTIRSSVRTKSGRRPCRSSSTWVCAPSNKLWRSGANYVIDEYLPRKLERPEAFLS